MNRLVLISHMWQYLFDRFVILQIVEYKNIYFGSFADCILAFRNACFELLHTSSIHSESITYAFGKFTTSCFRNNDVWWPYMQYVYSYSYVYILHFLQLWNMKKLEARRKAVQITTCKNIPDIILLIMVT